MLFYFPFSYLGNLSPCKKCADALIEAGVALVGFDDLYYDISGLYDLVDSGIGVWYFPKDIRDVSGLYRLADAGITVWLSIGGSIFMLNTKCGRHDALWLR